MAPDDADPQDATDPCRGAGRARPLPPDERRAALIAATLPLVMRHGYKVTTRQIAEAAGVAEGTIFRVFPYKDKLVQVAIGTALDPAPMLAELAAVELTLPLRPRLLQTTEILQRRLVEVFGLLTALGVHGQPEQLKEHRHRMPATNEVIHQAVSRVLEPDRERFRCPVHEVARMLRLVTFAGSHPLISDGNPLSADEIVSLVLDGVLRSSDPDPGAPTC